MKLKVQKDALLKALQTVTTVMGIRTTLPVLNNIRLDAEKGRLCLTATDLLMYLQLYCPAEVTTPGATTLPGKTLLNIVRELTESTLELDINEKHIASLVAGSSSYDLIGMSEEDFPPLEKHETKYTYCLPQPTLRALIRRTLYAASDDEQRALLHSVLLSFKKGHLSVVATDGKRLALAECEVEHLENAEGDYILPARAASIMETVLSDDGDVKLLASKKGVVLQTENDTLGTKLVEGTYPNYRQVIPGESAERVIVERELLLGALRRSALFVGTRDVPTKVTLTTNRLTLVTTCPDVGEAREVIPVRYSGRDLSIAFNPHYLMDPLKVLDRDEVSIELTDSLSPGVIRCDEPFLYVLMPVRLP